MTSKLIILSICILYCLFGPVYSLHHYPVDENALRSHLFNINNVKILNVRNATPPGYRLVNAN